MWAALVFVAVAAWATPYAGPTAALWLGGGAAVVVYLVTVWWFPRTTCWYCGPRGGPKRRDSAGKNWHRCFICGGSGERRRLGAWILGRGVDD